MKNKIYKIALVLSALVLTLACNEDEFTGDSTLTPSSPSLNVTLDFTNGATLVESETDYNFTVTLSTPQIVDVVVNVAQTGGTATEGDDFSIPHTLRIPAGETSLTGTISIHADAIIEDTETVTIQITSGTEANVSSINGATVTFNILNLEEGDLDVGLSWNMDKTTDNSGNEISPTAFADLRLLVSKSPNNNNDDDRIGVADGASFEHFVLPSDTPDGEYYIVADFYDASDIVRDIDLTLTFDQVGVIEGQTHEFPAALNNASICEANFYVLAKVTKMGDYYTFEEIGKRNFSTTTWSGVDTYDFYAPDGWPSHITTSVDCDGAFMLGLNAEWMLEVWGEEIQEEGNVYYTIDGSGNITIPSQFIFTTLYSGSLYDYTVSGTGTYDDSGATPVIHLEYVLDQDGFDVGAYWQGAGGMDTPYFVADITAE